jgi:NAD(P)-dependent dehydrogenase (short-subunit alcohol dehydrogenase family)
MTSAPLPPLALITGVGKATGIGFEAARQLAQHGFHVILTARNGDAASDLASRLQAEGLSVEGWALDVTDADAVTAAAERVAGQFPALDVLINNAAGVSAYGETAAAADLNAAQAILDVTLFGAWRMAQAFMPLLAKSANGRLVNVSSGAGSHADTVFGLTTANGMGTGYATAKAALNALTAKLAYENPDIRINAVCPGFTATFEGGAAMGARPVADGAKSLLWAALLPKDGPTGGFFRDGEPLGW